MSKKLLFLLIVVGGLGGAAVLFFPAGNSFGGARETLAYRVSDGLDGRSFGEELLRKGYAPLTPFALPIYSKSLCDLAEPTFPASVQPLEWFYDAGLNVQCYDGNIENESFSRICFQESLSGMILHAAIAEISLDGKAGTWTGRLLPEDWSRVCSELGS